MSFYSSLDQLPEDPIFKQLIDFRKDPRQEKINLAIGSYKDEEGKPYVLSTVRKAEEILIKEKLDKEYLLMEGDQVFCRDAQELLLNDILDEELKEKVFSVQTIGGSGALRLAGEFLTRLGFQKIYLSNPSWANHKPIFSRAGLEIEEYAYFNANTNRFDFEATCRDINHLPNKSLVLFHSCCHNPTGVDPSQEQWKELSQLAKRKNLLVFFDCAYQGFSRGIVEDSFAIKQFVKDGNEILIASSYSKNFGLYGERIGTLTAVCASGDVANRLGSHFKQLVRSSYSNPPVHGARIIRTILNSPELRTEWEGEVALMRNRIQLMRLALYHGLQNALPQRDFSYFLHQCGMFSYGGLTSDQVDLLRAEFGIYMPNNGRINLAGLNQKNLAYVINSILTVFK